MPRSRIIRVCVFVLMLGVGLWGVLVFPSFSQDPDGVARPAIYGGGNPPPMGLGLPGATPAGGLPPGAADVGAPQDPASTTDPPGGPTGDAFGEADLPFAGSAPQAYPGGATPPGAPSMPPGGAMGSMMGGGMGMPGMGPGGLTQSQIEEIKLARHAKTLLSRYSHEQKPEVKEKIKSELRSVLHRQFRLQHQRRDAELTKIEKRLADLRSRLKKRGDAQSTIVDRRLEQLVNDVDGLGWSADEIPDNLFNEGGMGSMMMPGMGAMGGMGMMPVIPAAGPPSGTLGGGGAGIGSEFVPDTEPKAKDPDPNLELPPLEGSSDLTEDPSIPPPASGTAAPASPPVTDPTSPGTLPTTIPGTGVPTNNPAAAEPPTESVPRSN